MITYLDNENSLFAELKKVESFEVYRDGEIEKITAEKIEFKTILSKLEDLFANSHLMPAFGVSLHKETLNAMKKDCWLKINFKEEMTKNDLSFSSLVLKLEKTSGFNFIRQQNGKFEGRCLFLDLGQEIDLKQLLGD